MPTPQISTFEELVSYIEVKLADNNSAAIDPSELRNSLLSIIKIQSLKNELLLANFTPDQTAIWNSLIEKLNTIQRESAGGIKDNATQTNAPTAYDPVANPQPYPNGLVETYRAVEPLNNTSAWYNLADATNKAKFPITQQMLDANDVLLTARNGVVSVFLNKKVSGENGQNKIPEWETSNKIFATGSQVLSGGKLWQAISLTTESDIPGISPKWKLLVSGINPFVTNKTNDILTATNNTLKSSISLDGNDVYIVAYDGSIFTILKNGSKIGFKIDYTFGGSGYTAISSFVKSGVIHILFSFVAPSESNNGLRYITYDINANTFTNGTRLQTSENARLSSLQIIEFGGVLYTAVNTTGVVISSLLNTSVSNYKVDLFRLNGTSWELVSNVSNYGEILGNYFVNDVSQDNLTVNDKAVVPTSATLYVKNNQLFCIWASFSGNTSRYLNVSKKTTDLLTWTTEKIQRYSVGINPVIIENNGIFYNASRITPILTPSSASSTMEFKIAMEDDYNYYNTGISNTSYNSLAYNNIGVYMTFNKISGSTSSTDYLFVNWDDIIKSTIPKAINYRGELYPDSVRPFNLKIGDYWDATGFGAFNNLEKSLDQYFSTYTRNKVEINLGETCVIIWNGSNFSKKVISDTLTSARNSFPYLDFANRNSFISRSFRIPIILETNAKTLLAFSDIRRTTGKDYDEIDIGLRRSYDGGKSWRDNIIVFKRELQPGFRAHDAGAVLDKVSGRIWAFGKRWNANVDPFNNAYWIANKSKSVFSTKYSDDNGTSWSAEIDLTSLRPSDAWHLSSGTSTGIQLPNGTLIQPIYIGYDDTSVRGGNKAGFIYKLSGSNTWQMGDIANDFGNNENQILQLQNGSLIMDCRNNGFGIEKRRFYELVSIGSGWIYRSDMINVQQQIGGVCESTVAYRGTYIRSQPTNYGSTSRQNITVFYSYDCINWEKLINVSNPINIAGGGYSSLVISDNYFGILHEVSGQGSIAFTDLNFYRNILR